MPALASTLRQQLGTAVKAARKVAEAGARKALEALAVHEPDPYRHMDEAQRDLRRKLRAQARQLGDGESHTRRGAYEIKHLVEKLAYDQWHRILFARFLLENDLLISPDHGVAVALDDCEELAPILGVKDAWAVAARFAATELPEIFRADDPAGAVDLPPEDRRELVQLVRDLPAAVFTADDSLGWCYQFWQAEQKRIVNESGNKIGADELPAVTQLFTEDYMVDFLLDNTLGAWHAARCAAVSSFKFSVSSCPTEEDARQAAALPGCPWNYLRFVRSDANDPSEAPSSLETEHFKLETRWRPAAGSFDGWPKRAAELKCLDPCMGSGHFIVAMFHRLVALRVAEEGLDEAAAVDAVIRDNLFGLEIDPRCTQIAAFNLALAAWKRTGHRPLPPMHLACSGLAPNAREADWLALAGDDTRLQAGMRRLYQLFSQAPVLGSLINPRAEKGDLFEAEFHELQPLLERALAMERADEVAHEMAVTAQGVAKAAEILAGQFTLVATNVPYLTVSKHDDFLREFGRRCYPNSRHDLATIFLERCLPFASTAAVVTPQNWLFLPRYEKLRQALLKNEGWHFACRLGPGAFATITGEVVKGALVGISHVPPSSHHSFIGIDVSDALMPSDKAAGLLNDELQQRNQGEQLRNPDARIVMEELDAENIFMVFADSRYGLRTADGFRFLRSFWEIPCFQKGWSPLQSTVEMTVDFGGREQVLFWENGGGALREFADHGLASLQGGDAWRKQGVTVSLMGNLPVTRYSGDFFDNNCAALWPRDPNHLAAVWAFCSSTDYAKHVRVLDQKMNVTSATLLKVPFDLARWQRVAAEKYPNGLPKPYSNDPTQWLFDGHPQGSDDPLHVAVARLLGYRWPRQTGSSFPDCPALGPDGLEDLADADGIVCISSIKGESPAADRLQKLLARAFGSDWNAQLLQDLLAGAGYGGKTLEDWLRNGFFEQHCALFHNRPFIWHIWDGHKNGFSALINYHRLDHANLEKLAYAYLGDWIRRQQAAVEAGEAGSDARLQAARDLQRRLKLILDGDPPHDIFVRWKPLSQQAIGWHPDLNDGVRMNIRPFATADVLRKRAKIKWDKDRGKEPHRDQAEYPWFWSGSSFTGDRLNDIHLTREQKEKAGK